MYDSLIMQIILYTDFTYWNSYNKMLQATLVMFKSNLLSLIPRAKPRHSKPNAEPQHCHKADPYSITIRYII